MSPLYLPPPAFERIYRFFLREGELGNLRSTPFARVTISFGGGGVFF